MIDRHKTRIKKVLEENHQSSSVWQLGDPVLSIIEEQQAQIEALEAIVKKQQDDIQAILKNILQLAMMRIHDIAPAHWKDEKDV